MRIPYYIVDPLSNIVCLNLGDKDMKPRFYGEQKDSSKRDLPGEPVGLASAEFYGRQSLEFSHRVSVKGHARVHLCIIALRTLYSTDVVHFIIYTVYCGVGLNAQRSFFSSFSSCLFHSAYPFLLLSVATCMSIPKIFLTLLVM